MLLILNTKFYPNPHNSMLPKSLGLIDYAVNFQNKIGNMSSGTAWGWQRNWYEYLFIFNYVFCSYLFIIIIIFSDI